MFKDQEVKIIWTPKLRECATRLHDPYLVRHKKKFKEVYGKHPNSNELLQYAKWVLSTSMESWSGYEKELKQNANNH